MRIFIFITIIAFLSLSQAQTQVTQKKSEKKLNEEILKQVSAAQAKIYGSEDPASKEAEDEDPEYDESKRISNIQLIGAFFVCDPYCEFVSHATTKGFESSVKMDKADPKSIRFYDVNSEVYRAVFDDKAKEEYLEMIAKGKKAVVFETTQDDQIATKEPDKFALPRMKPFIRLGIKLATDFSHKTSLGINQEMQDKGYYLTGAEFGIFPPKKFRFFKQQWKNYFAISLFSAANRFSSQVPPQKLQTSNFEITYRLFNTTNKKRYYFLSFSQETEDVKASDESPRVFSTKSDSYYIGLGTHSRRWYVEWLTNISTKVKDSQQYRSNPLKANINRIKVMYSHPYQLFSGKGDVEVAVEYRKTEEKSGIDPIYLVSQDEIKITHERAYLSLMYKFGF